jgi:hypothetical protein
VENHHVSHQSRHGNTHRFKERSSNGISIRATPAQKEVKGGKRYVYEKPRLQQHIKWRILDEYSDVSESSMERHRDPKHSRRTTAQTIEESYTKSLSANPPEEEEKFVQETPEAALVAAQAYLLTTQPKPGDPREHMHQAAIRSLGLTIEDKLRGNPPEKKTTHRRERRKEEFKCKSSRNETSESSGDEKRQKWKEDARNIIAQARVNNSRYAWREENYEDDEKEMGALCFTRRVRKTRVPKGFKLPHDQEKYVGRKNPLYGYQTTCKQYKYSEE